MKIKLILLFFNKIKMLWMIEIILSGFENKNILEFFFKSIEYICSSYLYSFYNIIYLFIFNINILIFTVLFPLFLNIILLTPLFLFDKIFHTNSKDLQMYISKILCSFIKINYNYIQIILKYFTIISIIYCIYFLYKLSVYKINNTKLKLQKIRLLSTFIK